MKSPYFASRNHSRRFSRAGSGGRVAGTCAPVTTTTAASAISATPAVRARVMSASEIQPQRQLGDPRRSRRVRDADRGAEVRVDLITGRVEPHRAIDVLELHRVEEIVDLDAELCRQTIAEAHVL